MTAYVLHRLWPWFPAQGITFGKHIFMKRPDDALTLEHELVHVQQQAAHPVWFWVSYLLLLPVGWNPWRMRWEAEAYAVQARAGCPIGGDAGLAAALASVGYGWCCRRDSAAQAIVEAASRKATP